MNALKDARVLTEAALAIALAFVLGLITLFRMPLGGSISLEMVPLILLAVRQGWKVGMLAGAAYGLLNLAVSPIILHPVQVLFDYPLPFAALGLAGLFSPTVRGPSWEQSSPCWPVSPPTSSPASLSSPPTHRRAGTRLFIRPPTTRPTWVPSLIVVLIAVPVLLRALAQARPSRANKSSER